MLSRTTRFVATAGTAIAGAKQYRGFSLVAGANAAGLRVWRGGAIVDAQQIDGSAIAANTNDHSSLDPGVDVSDVAVSGLFVEVTGATAVAIIYWT